MKQSDNFLGAISGIVGFGSSLIKSSDAKKAQKRLESDTKIFNEIYGQTLSSKNENELLINETINLNNKISNNETNSQIIIIFIIIITILISSYLIFKK